eukprot:gene13029-8875_t
MSAAPEFVLDGLFRVNVVMIHMIGVTAIFVYLIVADNLNFVVVMMDMCLDYFRMACFVCIAWFPVIALVCVPRYECLCFECYIWYLCVIVFTTLVGWTSCGVLAGVSRRVWFIIQYFDYGSSFLPLTTSFGGIDWSYLGFNCVLRKYIIARYCAVTWRRLDMLIHGGIGCTNTVNAGSTSCTLVYDLLWVLWDFAFDVLIIAFVRSLRILLIICVSGAGFNVCLPVDCVVHVTGQGGRWFMVFHGGHLVYLLFYKCCVNLVYLMMILSISYLFGGIGDDSVIVKLDYFVVYVCWLDGLLFNADIWVVIACAFMVIDYYKCYGVILVSLALFTFAFSFAVKRVLWLSDCLLADTSWFICIACIVMMELLSCFVVVVVCDCLSLICEFLYGCKFYGFRLCYVHGVLVKCGLHGICICSCGWREEWYCDAYMGWPQVRVLFNTTAAESNLLSLVLCIGVDKLLNLPDSLTVLSICFVCFVRSCDGECCMVLLRCIVDCICVVYVVVFYLLVLILDDCGLLVMLCLLLLTLADTRLYFIVVLVVRFNNASLECTWFNIMCDNIIAAYCYLVDLYAAYLCVVYTCFEHIYFDDSV